MTKDIKTLIAALDGLSFFTADAEWQIVVLDVHTPGPRSWRVVLGLYGPHHGLFSIVVDPAFEPHHVAASVRTCLEDWLSGRGVLAPERCVDMAARIVGASLTA